MGGMCRLAYATFGAMYKPAVISFYGALVAVCDLVYWRIIDGKPKATRVIIGHANHKSEPPISENALTFSCLVVVALVYVCWASVSVAFLPLAVVFFPITLIFGVVLPAILLYGVKAVLEWAERALDVRLKLEDRTAVAVNKSVLVKAILAQLVSTVVLVATTSRFYTEGGWSESIKAALELAGALRFDFTFNLAYTFGWPELPGLPAIHFAAAVGVLSFTLL